LGIMLPLAAGQVIADGLGIEFELVAVLVEETLDELDGTDPPDAELDPDEDVAELEVEIEAELDIEALEDDRTELGMELDDANVLGTELDVDTETELDVDVLELEEVAVELEPVEDSDGPPPMYLAPA
jgi:hypothetical protein